MTQEWKRSNSPFDGGRYEKIERLIKRAPLGGPLGGDYRGHQVVRFKR
jgi:hypothetical protein